MAKKFCFVATDAISFNILYRGQLEYLAENGCDLTLICGGNRSELDFLRARNVGRVLDYGLVRKPNLKLDLLSLIKLFWHFLFNRYDLVLTTTPKALLLGTMASFFTCQPRRVAFFQGRVYENFKGIKRFFYTLLDRLVIICSHSVIFVSNSLMTEFIKDTPAVVNKGRVIGHGSGNGVCSEKFSPDAVSASNVSMIRQELSIKDTDFIVLSVGRVCEDKGLNQIINVATLVAEKTTNVRFLILGNIEDDKAFAQLSSLRAKGIIDHIDFVTDITPYFALADIHLFLSHREGFGNVAIEAAAMHVPTVAFDVVGVRDSVAEGVSGLRFKFDDVTSVVNVILELNKNRLKIKEEFSGSRMWAVKNFSQKSVWKNYKDFYCGIYK